MDDETIERKDEFAQALKDLCQKYSVKNASFCGFIGDGLYSIISLDKAETINDICMSVTYVGRLWQHARTSMRSLLDSFERGV